MSVKRCQKIDVAFLSVGPTARILGAFFTSLRAICHVFKMRAYHSCRWPVVAI